MSSASAVERAPSRPGSAARARMLRAMLPALSLALVVIAIALVRLSLGGGLI